MKETVLITGATSGIGKSTARLLAHNGYRLILTGRRGDRLNELKQDLSKIPGTEIETLTFDVRNQQQVNQAIDSLEAPFSEIQVLINNAGLAVGMSAIQEGETEDWERMIDTNVKGLLYVSRKVAPSMISRNKGHIINVSSIAGKEVYPFGNVYCATKHAVQALTKSMRLEMLKNNIKVSSIAPGAVNTEFSLVRFKGDQNRADQVYNGISPLLAEDIAETILFILNRPWHVNIDDILITPTDQAYSRDFNRK